MITNSQWERYLYALHLEGAKNGKKVKSLEYELIASDVKGSFNITDLQIQDGKTASGTIPHTGDFLVKAPFNIDENYYLTTVTNPQKLGTVQPTLHTGCTNRFYNIVGRGHDAIVIPNVFHEDYTKKIVTTALDLTLYAKDDYDLLRISTNDGAFIPGRFYSDNDQSDKHPLCTQYTREFFFDGGLAGDKIELLTTIRSAKISGSKTEDLNLYAQSINIDNRIFSNNRQRLMVSPAGSFRIRIEFYKNIQHYQLDSLGNLVLDSNKNPIPDYMYLADTGIGYYGIAELNQWTYGRSKL